MIREPNRTRQLRSSNLNSAADPVPQSQQAFISMLQRAIQPLSKSNGLLARMLML